MPGLSSHRQNPCAADGKGSDSPDFRREPGLLVYSRCTPTIQVMGCTPRRSSIGIKTVHVTFSIGMFVMALLVVAPNWNNPAILYCLSK